MLKSRTTGTWKIHELFEPFVAYDAGDERIKGIRGDGEERTPSIAIDLPGGESAGELQRLCPTSISEHETVRRRWNSIRQRKG